jgi:ribosomal protein L37AE/L43A
VAVASPQAVTLSCPRCRILRQFQAIDGSVTWRCKACEWYYTFTAAAPTGTSSATLAAGGTAITVASGGASFTNGMILLYDTGTNTEVLTVNGSSTATSIPVTAAAKAHASAVTFGQLAIAPTYTGAGDQGAVIPAPGWGF